MLQDHIANRVFDLDKEAICEMLMVHCQQRQSVPSRFIM